MKVPRCHLLALALPMAVLACTTTITTRLVIQPVQDATNMKSMTDAITYVLTNNGFDVAFINEKYGLINTNWRPIQSSADTAASVLSIVGAAMSRGPSSYSTFSRDMMISFQLFANEYHVIPKLKHRTNTIGLYGGSSREDVQYPTPDSSEGKLVTKIIGEINGLLKIPDDMQWEEKVITVGQDSAE